MNTARLTHAALLALALGCAHTRTAATPREEEQAAEVGDQGKPEGEAAPASSASKKDEDQRDAEGHNEEGQRAGTGDPASASSGSGAAAGAAAHGSASDPGKGKAHGKPEKGGDEAGAEDIDVATSPQGLLQPGAMDKVRQKLGLSKGEGSTDAALRRFQREHDLPATGMLDHETVEKLGLSPDEIFEK